MSTRAEARAAVLRIAKTYGILSDEAKRDMENLKPETRRELEEMIIAKDLLAGGSIITLARNIYGSEARLVFELLQNADDNSYRRVAETDVPPRFSFEMYKDRIIVESNEDGFTVANLNAICEVGKSTKTKAHGYIGAKGIGFKSVFIVARKVDIQSGNFTFSFIHEKNGSGLGMVTPIWNEDAEILPMPCTRITLHLHDEEFLDGKSKPPVASSASSSTTNGVRDSVLAQLADLQPSMLLFLQQIRELSITMRDGQDLITSHRNYKRSWTPPYLQRVLVTEKGNAGLQTSDETFYHMTTYTASHVPASANRETNEHEASAARSSQASVVLAFPLTPSYQPKISNQHIFAFLPVRESNFSFLIQADFDTSANRQDILPTSLRNIALRDAVSKAFTKAAVEFCQQPERKLRFSWPLFLPRSVDGHGAFWSNVVVQLRQALPTIDCLYSRRENRLRTPRAICILASDARDQDDEPLLDDESEDPFISSTYSGICTAVLRDYGLAVLSCQRFLALLELDLASAASRMKGDPGEHWHTAVSNLLVKHISVGGATIRKLNMIPLVSGHWVNSAQHTVYFPYTDGQITIPSGIALNLLCRKAYSNAKRRELFDLLGVKQASVDLVRTKIFERYVVSKNHITIAASKRWLHYLYLTHEHHKVHEQFSRLEVYDRDMLLQLVSALYSRTYLPSIHPYGPEKLLALPSGTFMSSVHFLHSDYLDDPPKHHSISVPSWQKWLVTHVGLHDKIALVNRDQRSLSDEWKHVCRYYPKTALHLLEYRWNDIRERVTQVISNGLKNTFAGAMCVNNFTESDSLLLQETWLPLPDLIQQVDQYMANHGRFPFLDLGSTCTTAELNSKWLFLHDKLSVSMKDDHTFLLDVLKYIVQTVSLDGSEQQAKRFLKLYVALQSKILASVWNPAARNVMLSIFESTAQLYIHSGEGRNAHWAKTEDCLWEGPTQMTTKLPLEVIWKQVADKDDLVILRGFVGTTLGVRNASIDDLIVELRARTLLAEAGQTRGAVAGIYKYLARLATTSQRLREIFNTEKLIFSTDDYKSGWLSSSECLWSNNTNLRGKANLRHQYPELEKFFVETLQVKQVTMQMLVDSLAQPHPQMSVPEVKHLIESINAMITDETRSQHDPQRITESRILPVRYPNGSVILVSSATEFWIGDQESLIDLFKDKVKLLDFSFEEQRRLRPFLSWLRFNRRFLSDNYKQVTSLPSAEEQKPLLNRRNVKRKAYGLLRIAHTFESAKSSANPEGLYQTLCSAQTVSCGKILTFFRVHQGGADIDVATDLPSCHIDDSDGTLRIYVPRKKKAQELCFRKALPMKLGAWLMQDSADPVEKPAPREMVRALSNLLTVDANLMDQILETDSILPSPIPRSQDDMIADEDDDSDDDDMDETIAAVNRVENEHVAPPDDRLAHAFNQSTASRESFGSAANTTPRGSHDRGDIFGGDEIVYRESSTMIQIMQSFREFRISPRPRAVARTVSNSDQDSEFLNLLNHVVGVARQKEFSSSYLQTINASDVGVVQRNLDSYDGWDLLGETPSDSHFFQKVQIGAAGELFVYVLLSRAGLPSWTYSNWQSRIRHLAAIHADFRDLTQWHDRETSDLVYNDVEGQMTGLLVRAGRLPQNRLQQPWPKYHLEVKTTKGPNNTAFYVSKNQHNLMHGPRLTSDLSTIYIILRVYNLMSSDIGLQIYVDPAQLKEDRSLIFTPEVYSVVPSMEIEL